MKQLFAALLTAVALIGCHAPKPITLPPATPPPVAITKTVKRPIWHQFPGAYVYNHCLEYSLAVEDFLRDMRIPCTRVEYFWLDVASRSLGVHSVVVFRLNEKHYVVENEGATPVEVCGDNLLDLIQSFDSNVIYLRRGFDTTPLP